MKKYYSMVLNKNEADIYIFGEIVIPLEKELWGLASDTSGLSLANDVKDLDVDVINVHINSYGGVVSEGLAIHNTLKNHKAKTRTYCDGFACSAASVIFMAGDERIMNSASLLMIHNAWRSTAGNATQLRKDADDLEIITQASIEAYKARANIDEAKIKELMDAETWILPDKAVEWGLATEIIETEQSNKAAASAQKALFSLLKNGMKANSKDEQVDLDELAGKIIAKLEAKAETEVEAEAETEEETETETETEQENKPLKFFNALLGKEEE